MIANETNNWRKEHCGHGNDTGNDNGNLIITHLLYLIPLLLLAKRNENILLISVIDTTP
jgi:hypothetical protein